MPEPISIANPEAPNLTELYVGKLTLWFSYQTCVAFAVPGHGRVVCANRWGAMTGKHLNLIDKGQRGTRLPREQFDKALAFVQEAIGGTLDKEFTVKLAGELAELRWES